MTPNQRRHRQIWLKIHSTLALSVGLLFVLVGITGSFNVFGPVFDRWITPELSIEAGPGTQQSPDELMAAVRAAHPRRFGAWTLQFPEIPGSAAIAWYDTPIETSDESYAPLMVAIDPYTGRILANRYWGHTLASWIYLLHSQLLLGDFGQKLAGLIGLALLVSLIAGIRLWLPSRRRIRQAFTLKPKAGFKRRVFDLHRVTGIYGAFILITAALTGLHLAYPAVLETVLGVTEIGHHVDGETTEITSSAQAAGAPLNLAQAMLMARGLFPNAVVHSITTPRGSNGVYRVDFRRPGEDLALTAVWVDQYSGQIRHARNSANLGQRQRFVDAIRPLHNGSLLGFPGRWLWFLAGFAPLALYLTGMIHWLHKRRGNVPRFRLELPARYTRRLWHRYWPALHSALLRSVRKAIAEFMRIVAVLAKELRLRWTEHRRRNTSPRE